MRIAIVLLASLAGAPDLLLLRGDYASRKFDEIYASGNAVWLGIAALGGTDLYRFDEAVQTAQRFRVSCEIDSVEALHGDGTAIYIGDRTGGLFRLRGNAGCEKILQLPSRIRALAWDAGRSRLWIAADGGLSTWSSSGVQDQQGQSLKAKALKMIGDTLWLGTEQGLWKYDGRGFERQDLSTDLNQAEINAVEFAAGQIWIGDHQRGLHRWSPGAGQPPVPVEFGAAQVTALFRHGSSLLVGSENGLRRVNVSEAAWDPKVRIAELDPRSPRPGERVQLKWEITNYDERTSPALVDQRVDVLTATNQVAARAPVRAGVFELALQAPPAAGEYRLRFVATDLTGREAFSEPAGATLVVPAASGGWLLTGALLIAVIVGLGVYAIHDRRQRQARRAQGAALESKTIPAPPPPAVFAARGVENALVGATGRALKVFLCHSSNDKPQVRLINTWLREVGADPWLDEEKILAGQDWEREITVAVPASDAVLVCLSKGSVSKGGYLQKELRFALDVAEQHPEGTVFLIPVKLEECEPPIRLRHLHWVNLFEDQGYTRLFAALRARAASQGVRLGSMAGRAAAGPETR